MRPRGHNAEIKLRMPEELRAMIEAAAARRDASMNAEILRRLNASFTEERALGGPEMLYLAAMVVAAFKSAARMYAPDNPNPTTNREAYRRGVFAALDAMLSTIPDVTPEEIALEIEGLKSRLLSRVISDELRGTTDSAGPKVERRRRTA